MKRKAKTVTSRKKIVVILAVLVVFSLIIFVGLEQSQPKPVQAADKYFQVVSAAVEPSIGDRIDQNGTVWIIHAVTFTFKPILGEAHGVLVKSWANSEPQDVGDVLMNQLRTVILTSKTGAAITQSADGKFRVTVSIDSMEATGPLTLVLSA